MTTAITRQAIRRALFDMVPGLGVSSVADGVTTTTLTDAFTFKDTTLGQNHYRGYYLYRPDVSGDDRIKKILSVNPSTGTATIAGSNYSDVSDTNFELMAIMHPDELNACIQRAQTRMYFEYQTPHTGVLAALDGDMEASTTSNWTNVGLATMAKDTTAGNVLSGFRSMHTLANSTNDYMKTAANLNPYSATAFYASTCVRVVSGTVSLIIYDITNSAAIGTAVTSTVPGFVHLWCTGQIPTTCQEVSIRANSVTSTAEAYWNHITFYPTDRFNYPMPSWVDEPWKFLKLREARYQKSLNSQTNGGYDDAYSRQMNDWLQPSMFSLDPFHLDANPYQLQLMKPVPSNELWIEGKRPFSDIEPLGGESSTTLAPTRLVYSYCKDEVARVLTKRFPNDLRWKLLAEEAIGEIDAETRARTEVPLQPIRREQYGRI